MSEPRPHPGSFRRRAPFLVTVLSLAILGSLLGSGTIVLPPEIGRRIHALFNYAEAGFWAVAAFVVLWRCRRSPPARGRIGACASMAFLAFGASDLVEVQTGAWFRPWWLLVWKVSCGVALVACWLAWARRDRPPQNQPPP